ncbi:MAG TPA: Vacuolar H+transporting two-sector ATPase F subunit [Chloroflexi bacterium]|jgi:vacuolar-type H+-ATPase subunit F/Vma7|nr:Vacuolar H+transporting two-sector ATPase F subunit [Chloroflexota bacterium]
MKIRVIGNSEAVQGFALVGIQGEITATADEANAAIDHALAMENIGIVLITEDAAVLIQARIDQLKFQSEIPLVVVIPAPNPVSSKQESLNEIIERAIGIKF